MVLFFLKNIPSVSFKNKIQENFTIRDATSAKCDESCQIIRQVLPFFFSRKIRCVTRNGQKYEKNNIYFSC